MGGIKSKALRPFKGYNFEHRAQRLVKKEQESAAPKAAPKHASSQELLEKHAAAHPEIMQELKAKDVDLVKRMNQLKIEQTSPGQQDFSSERKLPENRKHITEPELAFEEPDLVPEGKASLTQMHTFLNEHVSSERTYTAQQISNDYKLDSAMVEQVIKHFIPLNVQFQVSEKFKKEHKKLTKQLEKEGFITDRPTEESKIREVFQPKKIEPGKT